MTRHAMAQYLGVSIAQVVEMPTAYDALAGAFGMQRSMGQVFKVVDDLEYPLYIMVDNNGDIFRRRHILGITR